MKNQAYLFIIFILNGFLIGVLIDIFRILRKAFKTKDIITYFEDILFWVISGGIVLYTVFKFNNGELRGFIFLGIIVGVLIYMLIFSKIFIKINLFIINFIKKFFYFIFIIPIKFTYKVIRKLFLNPISFIIINFRKILSNIKIKTKSLYNKNKKADCRKDFT